MKTDSDKDSEEPTDSKRTGVRRWIGRILATLILIVLFLGLVAPSVLDAPLLFLFGWIGFLMRVVPEITLDWDMLGLAAICFTIILFLSHALIRAFIRTRNQNSSTSNASWKLRSTLSLNLLVWLSFFIATTVSGLVHQIRWIAQSDEPITYSRRLSIMERIAAHDLATLILMSTEVDLQSVPSALEEIKTNYSREFITPKGRFSKLRAFCLTSSTGGFHCVVVFPRELKTQETEDVHVAYRDGPKVVVKRSELRNILTEPGISAVPLF